MAQPPPNRVAAAELVNWHQVPPADLDDGELSGLKRASKPTVLTWRHIYLLALVRAAEAGKPGQEGPVNGVDVSALEERARKLGVSDFNTFRDDYFLGAMAGGPRPFREPAAGTLGLLCDLQKIENARRDVTRRDNLFRVLLGFIRGEASGITQLDVDRVGSALDASRDMFLNRLMDYGERLDRFKLELGLSSAAGFALDRKSLLGFHDAFGQAYAWFGTPRRNLESLPRIASQLPVLEDLVIDGRFVAGVDGEHLDRLADLLAEAAQAAIRYRKQNGSGRVDHESDEELARRVRQHLRRMVATQNTYKVETRHFVLLLREADQLLEQIFAPPDAQLRTSLALERLIATQDRLRESEDRLVTLWARYNTDRIAISRDLGKMLYPDWGSFLGQFVAKPPEKSALEVEVATPPPAPRAAVPAPPPAPGARRAPMPARK